MMGGRAILALIGRIVLSGMVALAVVTVTDVAVFSWCGPMAAPDRLPAICGHFAPWDENGLLFAYLLAIFAGSFILAMALFGRSMKRKNQNEG